MATRQKLKDFLSDSGYSTTVNRIGITVDPEDMGPTDQFNEGDDLGIEPATGQDLVGLQNPQTEGGLIGDFLKYLTDLTDNAYRLKGGNTPAVSIASRLGDDGKGVPLEASDQQGAEDVFIATSQSERNTLGSVMAQYSNGYFPAQDLQDIISKDNVNPELSGKYAQELLSSIEGEDFNKTGKTYGGSADGLVGQGAPFVKKSAQQILIDRSRFSPGLGEGENGAAYAPTWETSTSQFESGEDKKGTTTEQTGYGAYDKDAAQVVLDDLKNVGRSLLLRSANWDKLDPAQDPNSFTYDDTSNIYEAGDFVGGNNQTKISPSNLRAKEAYGAPDVASSGENLIDLNETTSSRSFGSMTTDGIPFSSEVNRIILIAQAAAAVAAMIKICKETWDLIQSDLGSMVNLERGPYFKGQATAIPKQAQFAIFRSTALINTRHAYNECVDEGFKVLFNTGISSPDVAKITEYPQIAEAPGFWFGVARKILRGFVGLSSAGEGLSESFTSSKTTSAGLSSILHNLQNNDVIRIMNVAAMIGDVSITTNGMIGRDDTSAKPVGQWNVDRLPDGPATRVSKSRSQKGLTSSALAWRGNSVPALYMIPRNVMIAAIEMGTLGTGTNPLKGHVGSTLVKNTYIDVAAEGPGARIPSDVVERFENLLDAEYVPFYFHDLRTNEIVTFHAFISDLSDSYTPDYTEARGYGRVDSVKIYKSTTRKIRFSFHVAATSKEDFNEMWFKINKLTTLVYPQWTEGTKISALEGASTFIQPFSQVMGASPIIRLRIGDVIKSNYSMFNLARIFGVGNSGIAPTTGTGRKAFKGLTETQFEKIFGNLYGSPMATLLGGKSRALRAVGAQLLKNGFANPLGVFLIMRELQDPDSDVNPTPPSITAAGALGAVFGGQGTSDIKGYTVLSFPYLKASINNGYVMADDEVTRWRITHPIRVMVLSRDQVILAGGPGYEPHKYVINLKAGAPLQKTQYTVMIMDFNAPFNMFGKKFIVSHADLMPNPDTLFNTYVLPAISLIETGISLAQGLANEVATVTGIPADTLVPDWLKPTAAVFMHAGDDGDPGNPITKAFESTAGRGLAGVIRSINYTWLDAQNTWEVDWNSRAPKFFKVSIDFDPIHDIPPGLDYSGYNRAPLYNVGDTMQKIAGDPYRDNGRASHDSYKNQGRLAAQANNPDKD